MSIQEYIDKARRYCAYQERCEYDLREKLRKFDLPSSKVDQIVHLMKQEKFVDDERFATSFVRSKLRSNSWGKSKIKYALKQKRIDPSFIEQAFEDVDEDFYQEKITLLAQKKFDKLKGDLSLYEKRQKTAVYLQSKGYESSLIFPIINNLGSDE